MEELRLGGLSDERVLERVEVLVRRSNETTAELLAYLAEMDSRGLHRGEACGSLFAYCVERLHMSEATAGKRITAARTARRFPALLEMIARGDIHLCGVILLAPHLTADNHRELLARARHLSKREIEKLVAEIAPRPDAPSRVVALAQQVAMPAAPPRTGGPAPGTGGPAPDTGRQAEERAPGRAGARPAGPPAVVAPLAPQRYQIRVTVDEETHAALCQLQDLLSHQIPDRDPAAIISRALAHELERTLARRTRATTRPRRAMATAPAEAAPDRAPARRTRHVPAAACREVWQRDGGRCAFVDPKGRRCSSTRFLELHHVNNWARGAAHDPAEMELRCRAHNQYQAELDYGAAFMAAKRRAARSSAGESGAVYGSAPARSAGRRKRCEQAGAPAADSLGAHRATSSGRGAGARHVPWTQPPSTQRPPPPNTGMQAGPASAGTANTPAAKKGRLTAMGP